MSFARALRLGFVPRMTGVDMEGETTRRWCRPCSNQRAIGEDVVAGLDGGVCGARWRLRWYKARVVVATKAVA